MVAGGQEEGGMKKRKKEKKKKPFVLTELEIAAGVCEDCELRVRPSQDHPPRHSMTLAKESEIGSGGERGEGGSERSRSRRDRGGLTFVRPGHWSGRL